MIKRRVKKQTKYFVEALKQHEKRTEKTINLIRLIEILFLAIGDNISLIILKKATVSQFLKLNMVVVVYLAAIFIIYFFLQRHKYYSWLKYFAITSDYLNLMFFSFIQLNLFADNVVIKNSSMIYIFIIFLLLINLTSALRYGKAIVVYSGIVCLIFFTVLYSNLKKYSIDLDFYYLIAIYFFITILIFTIVSYLISKNISKNINMNFELEEKNKRIKQDLKLAKDIQKSIISTEYSDFGNINIDVVYQPLIEVGGDIYDLFKFKNGNYRIFLADATGHGVQAALTTMLIKAEYEKIKLFEIEPERVMSILNNAFTKKYYSLNVFLTGIVIDVDFINSEVTYCSAGHPTQYIIKNENKVISLQSTGKLLGIKETMKFNNRKTGFNAKDKIILFSDGIFEEFNSQNEEYGEERLYYLIEKNKKLNPAAINEKIINEIEIWCKQEFNDDITLIVFEIKI